MEHFFTPTRRLHDWYDCIGIPLEYTEVQLAVSIESFMNQRWGWSDLYDFATEDEREMWIFFGLQWTRLFASKMSILHWIRTWEIMQFYVLRLRQQVAKHTTWFLRNIWHQRLCQPKRPASFGMQ
jgi:hypothetical protein